MAFNVRLFGHAGLTKMHVMNAHQLFTDSVFQLAQPYLWASGALQTNGATPVSYTNNALPAGQTKDNTDILRVEIPDGQAIRYEINNGTRNVAPSVNSPRLEGNNQIKFGSGWQFSFIDASAVAT